MRAGANPFERMCRRHGTRANERPQVIEHARVLAGNERVVVSAGPFLNPGQRVKPRQVAANSVTTAAAAND